MKFALNDFAYYIDMKWCGMYFWAQFDRWFCIVLSIQNDSRKLKTQYTTPLCRSSESCKEDVLTLPVFFSSSSYHIFILFIPPNTSSSYQIMYAYLWVFDFVSFIFSSFSIFRNSSHIGFFSSYLAFHSQRWICVCECVVGFCVHHILGI